jgi:4-diphosphocytidyl-2-C-methyl-D-erythritol kinase
LSIALPEADFQAISDTKPNTSTPMKLRLTCPAKVNLFLAVGPPDARGYHPLRTIFQAVDLCDEMVVEFGDSRETAIEVVGAELPSDNTVSKALRLSREIFSIQPSHIRLVKKIPMQSGLGGGSSDAAGVLRAFAFAQGRRIDEEMLSVAAAIGADVPFFLVGGRARGDGYGDIVTPLPDPPEDWFVIAKPDIGCSTVEMYKKLDANPRDWKDWPEDERLWNDFERVAPKECLDLMREMWNLEAEEVGLSGSGSSVFARFREESEAVLTQGLLGRDSWLAQSLSRAQSLEIERID